MSRTITSAVQAVQEFHDLLQISPKCTIDQTPDGIWLEHIGHQLIKMSKVNPEMLQHPDVLCGHLFLEEIGEMFIALARKNEVEFLDGMADVLYILCGRAAQYDMPLEAAFEEVHRSNMTKEKQSADPAAARVRVKGPNYSAPDLAEVLRKHREPKGPLVHHQV